LADIHVLIGTGHTNFLLLYVLAPNISDKNDKKKDRRRYDNKTNHEYLKCGLPWG
jgi:hypothetical protein